jgi:hypothetical protein
MTTPLFDTTLVLDQHVRSFKVRPARPADGWEAFEWDDQRVVHQQRFRDWHRLERTLTSFTRKIAELRALGWREA